MKRRVEKDMRATTRSGVAGLSGFSFLFSLFLACGDDSSMFVASDELNPRHNVLVMDDGFDLSVSAFSGRVAGAYVIVCQSPLSLSPVTAALDAGMGSSFEADKAAYIAELGARDESCRIRPGIAPKPNPFATIAGYRGRWNEAVSASKSPSSNFNQHEWAKIQPVVNKGLENSDAHGTAVAGVIAHANPAVRLVLVELALSSVDQLMDDFVCIQQGEVDSTVKLLQDADVRAAYLAAPQPTLDDDLDVIVERHNVGLFNASFGPVARQTIEEWQVSAGCPPVDLAPYMEVLGGLMHAYEMAGPAAPFLTVRAAGNEGRRIDGLRDTTECRVADGAFLTVGSYDAQEAPSEFTNTGGCVDLYAPGELVIAPWHGGWLFPLSGTSFASPLVARLLSMEPATGAFSPAGTRTSILATVDAELRLRAERFPPQLLFRPTGKGHALTSTETRAAARNPRSNRVDVAALAATLRPLKIFRR